MPSISTSISGGTGAVVAGVSPLSQTVLFDDMEGLLKWVQLLGTVSKSTTRAYNGSNSLSLAAGAGGTCLSGRALPTPSSGKVSLETYWACTDFSNVANLYFSITNAVNTRVATIQYVPSTHYWQVLGNVGLQTLLESYHTTQYLPMQTVAGCWHRLKFIVDWNLNKYVSLEVDDMLLLLNNYSCVNSNVDGALGTSVFIAVVSNGGAVTLFVDDFRVAIE